MSKVEINNEIVLLRRSVRQARFCTVNKLIRESKRLRMNHGDQKQLDKNKNRADKLVREVYALKKIKDDQISQYGIKHFEKLNDILQNPSTDDKTRAMIKIIRHKPLNAKIKEFVEKFPDYDAYLSSKKKKHVANKPSRKSERLTKRAESDAGHLTDQLSLKDLQKSTDDEADQIQSPSDHEDDHNDTNDKSVSESLAKEPKEKPDTIPAKKARSSKSAKIHTPEESSKNKASPSVKVISKEATVKRFTEILQGEEKIDDEPSTSKSPDASINLEKVVDDFFMSADGENTHLRVTAPWKGDDTHSDEHIASNYGANAAPRTRSAKDNSYGRRIERRNGRRETKQGKNTLEKFGQSSRGNSRPQRRKEIAQAEATSESLHPSWIAKKKQQEILKQGFQGKKIMFDDD